MRAPSSVHPTLSDNTPTEGADVACRHATHSEREPSMQYGYAAIPTRSKPEVT